MRQARRRIDADAIEDLAVGSAVLGTGGGGDPHIGKIIAAQAIDEHGAVDLVDPDTLQDDDVVIMVSMAGAPTVSSEKIPNGGELNVVFERARDYAGRPPAAIIPVEIGGINSLFPVAVAARAGVPLIDADGMGRAFPEFQMTAFNVGGVRFGPRFVTHPQGNVLRIEGIDAAWIERINRHALIAMGGSVITALAITGADVKGTAIRGTLSLAMTIGEAIRQAQEQKRSWADLLLPAINAFPLFTGKVISVERRTAGGFARGHAILSGFGAESETQVRIDFQNEHLLARAGQGGTFDHVLASTPDLITVLDSETGTPITTEGLRYGQRATIIGMPCDPIWRTPRGLELAGPGYFGWDIEYVPIEERMAQRTRQP